MQVQVLSVQDPIHLSMSFLESAFSKVCSVAIASTRIILQVYQNANSLAYSVPDTNTRSERRDVSDAESLPFSQ